MIETENYFTGILVCQLSCYARLAGKALDWVKLYIKT